MDDLQDEEEVEEVTRENALGKTALDAERMEAAMQVLEAKGLLEINKETGQAIVSDELLQAALASLEEGEEDGIIEVNDAAMGLKMQPSSFNWRRIDRQKLESMEELITNIHAPILQIMTPTALNPIVPALGPIAQAQRAYDQWQKAEAKQEAEEQKRELAARQAQESEQQLVEQHQSGEIWANDWGFYDGRNFYLRCFAAEPSQGTQGQVNFSQSMGKIMLRYRLTGAELDLSQEDGGLIVEMSAWQIQVSTNVGGHPAKIEALCGDLSMDIRRSMSWWTFEENEDDPDTVTVLLVLIKLQHKKWDHIWNASAMNPRRKKVFSWTSGISNKPQHTEDTLLRLPQGSPQERGEMTQLYEVTPEEFATGVQDGPEDADCVTVLIHLDQEVLEQVTSQIPFEDSFAADVTPSSLEVFVRTTNSESRIFAGELTGHVIPQYSSWQLIPSIRREVPPNSEIKAPAYWNPALRIRLVKDLPRGFLWGSVFKPERLVLANLRLPRQYRPLAEREAEKQKALATPPVSAAKAKAEPQKVVKETAEKKKAPTSADIASQLCKSVQCSQDDEWGYVVVLLDESLERAAAETSTNLKEFLGVRIEEEYLEVFAKTGGQEFMICEGYLGGRCVATESWWDIKRMRKKGKGKGQDGKGKGKGRDAGKGKDKGKSEKGSLALKVGLAKAFTSMRWSPVFDQQETEALDDPERTTMDGVPFLD